MAYRLGIDIGSTTIKAVVLDSNGKMLFSDYNRHNTKINETLVEVLEKILKKFGRIDADFCITGSVGMGISEKFRIPFIQEVVSAAELIKNSYPEVKTLIDIGGEDTKLIVFNQDMQPDIRMNGNCAGGTGAFIDQMAALMNIELKELSELSEKSTKIYPIASRCGVFAKTDVQNLLSRHIPKEDIAASIFHAVAIQCINALSRGVEIKPKLIFCGGPMKFIPALKKSFITILKLENSNIIELEHSELIPALGAAVSAQSSGKRNLKEIIDSIKNHSEKKSKENDLKSLFNSKEEYEEWAKTRMDKRIKRVHLKNEEEYFLGIDSGSSTTKIVLINKNTDIAFEYYANNSGNAITAVRNGLKILEDMARIKKIRLNITKSAVTGYGEDLIKAAFGIDLGIVETLAHYNAAKKFCKEVSFILDIGGQDMKAIFINNGLITNLEINEACSSGCGSFIQNFADSLGISVSEFAERACSSKSPCDLGTRCTVFMNSKVKQYLREGTSVNDISAGLAYSVIKNCFNKVLRLNDFSLLGENIVVQGGTFRNPAVHRAMELITGKKVYCSDIPELMGCFGCALIAKELSEWQGQGTKSDMEEKETKEKGTTFELEKTKSCEEYRVTQLTCSGCENNCNITKLTFKNKNCFFTGNRCEKIYTNKGSRKEMGTSLPDIKYRLLFDRKTIKEKQENSVENKEGKKEERNKDIESEQEAKNKQDMADEHKKDKKRIVIGIPRVLNFFENYPFWCTLFVECGIEVKLSSKSPNQISEKGLGTVMSENICYPAKIVHNHIAELIDIGVDRIFYPIVVFETQETEYTHKPFNCPVVSGYPSVIRSSINPERYGVPYDMPVMNFWNRGLLKEACLLYITGLGIDKETFEYAFEKALSEQDKFKAAVLNEGRKIIDKSRKKGMQLVVLAGRPYHLDPQINHNIPEIISGFGVNVITEDSLPNIDEKVEVMNQWSYPGRVYNAAHWCGKNNALLLQLNSFGCGPDAIVCDEVKRILKEYGSTHPLIRIDEISSPGSLKLRIRSLIESSKMKKNGNGKRIKGKTTPIFEEKDRKRTIIAPFFSEFYSPFIGKIFRKLGYNIEILPPPDSESVNLGLKYANNEICYPATIVIGDVIKALQGGKYDNSNIAVGITQTGGQCRASNYLALIKKAMISAGYGDIPVVSVSTSTGDFNPQPGFKFSKIRLFREFLRIGVYADAIASMYYATAVREINKGEAKRLRDLYIDLGVKDLNSDRVMLKLISRAVKDFNNIRTHERDIPKMGIVGEIYVKYNQFSHSNILEWLMEQEIEVIVPHLLNFFIQGIINVEVSTQEHLKRKDWIDYLLPFAEKYINNYLAKADNILKDFRYYKERASIREISENASEIINLVLQFGEGWLLSGEIMTLSHEGVNNILCLQPFGCIANHVIAKGIERKMKEKNPHLNILYLDMDHASSEANIYNRLHFLVKAAKTG